MFALVLIPGAPLRDLEKGTIVPSPFISGIVPILLLYFIIVGTAYGQKTGKFKGFSDIVSAMEGGIKSISGLIVLILPMAMFVETFNESNMSSVMAIKLADILSSLGLTGTGLFVGIILVVAFLNFFNTSGSSKWALLSPIFVPMMYYLGYSPAFTQLLYRIGDTSTNTITPLKGILPLYLAVARKYDKDAGVGSIISRCVPFALLFTAVLTIMALIWFYFKLPIGPGVSYFVN